MKIIVITFAVLLYSVTMFSQDSPSKCFPSGCGLRSAKISADNQYVFLFTVKDLCKVFEVKTGKLVNMSEDYEDLVKLYPMPRTATTAPEPPRTYYYTSDGNEEEMEVVIKQLSDRKPVASGKFKAFEEIAFDEGRGILILRAYHATYVMKPGSKPKNFSKNNYNWGGAGEYFSPDGRFYVSTYGGVLDIERGVAHERVVKNGEKLIPEFSNSEQFQIFNPDEYILQTYSTSTGKLLFKIEPPADLPRIDGFRIVPATDGSGYLYYMQFDNVDAPAGLAYWVKNGKSTSLCDPTWEEESKLTTDAYWDKNIKQLQDYSKEEAERKAEADRIAAQQAAEAASKPKSETSQSETGSDEAPAMTAEERKAFARQQNYKECPVCKGTGGKQVASYSSKKEKTFEGAGRTEYTTTTKESGSKWVDCFRCAGKGSVRK